MGDPLMTTDTRRPRAGLGRGLASLIPVVEAGAPAAQEVPISRILANPYQPRASFPEDELDALTASIAAYGVLQPIVLTETPDGFRLIAGERRLRASVRAGRRPSPRSSGPPTSSSSSSWPSSRTSSAPTSTRWTRPGLPSPDGRVRAHPGAGGPPGRALARSHRQHAATARRRARRPGRTARAAASRRGMRRPGGARPSTPTRRACSRRSSSEACPCVRPSSSCVPGPRPERPERSATVAPGRDDPDIEDMTSGSGRPSARRCPSPGRKGGRSIIDWYEGDDLIACMSSRRSHRDGGEPGERAGVRHRASERAGAPTRRTRSAAAGAEYGADAIQVLEGLEAVRRRPGMYIGSTDVAGPAPPRLGGRGQLDRRGDGRPRHARSRSASCRTGACATCRRRPRHPGRHPEADRQGRARGRAHGAPRRRQVRRRRLQGVRRSPRRRRQRRQRALRAGCGSRSARDGKVWTARSTSAASRTGPVTSDRTAARPAGTTPRSCPTPRSSKHRLLASRPSPSASASRRTSPRASISVSSTSARRPTRDVRSTSRAGIASFVRHLNKDKETLNHRPSPSSGATATRPIEVALQYNDGFAETVLAFANNINTVDGGTHVTGFRAALTSSLNDWARKPGHHQGLRGQPLGRRRARGPDRGHQRQAAPIRSSRARPRRSSATRR